MQMAPYQASGEGFLARELSAAISSATLRAALEGERRVF
jgi:hypothetical protein